MYNHGVANHWSLSIVGIGQLTISACFSHQPLRHASVSMSLHYRHDSPILSTSPALPTCLPLVEPCVTATIQPEPFRSGPEHHILGLELYGSSSRDEHHRSIQQGSSLTEPELPTTVVNGPSVIQSSEDAEMKQVKTKCTIGLLSTLIAYVSVNSWMKTHHPEAFIWCDEDLDEAKWVATSNSWLDRKACRWLGICGGLHMHFADNPFGRKTHHARDFNRTNESDWKKEWNIGFTHTSPLQDDGKQQREIPDYVIEYAPLVHLFSDEQFWPCDPAEHLFHTTPALNYTPIQSKDQHASLADLDDLNQWDHGYHVFLTSNDDVEQRPEWLEGTKNIPEDVSAENAPPEDNDGWVHRPPRTYLQGLRDAANTLGQELGDDIDVNKLDTGDASTSDETVRLLREEADSLLRQELKRRSVRSAAHPYAHKIKGGRSSAPAILITVPKPDGVVDAFWFFFYSFNLGNSVLNFRFGNHVGDWEHTAVRFRHGKPEAVYFSEHNFGSAYSYEAVEKLGKRPVIYSATGTHAMYATPGLHPYILPFGILHDETDRGPLWDPALNHHSFTYDFEADTLLASTLTPKSPTGWFHFSGHWGDKFYPLGDKRQYRFAGQYHYVNGPLGPKFKNLARKQICGGPDGTPCVIKHWLGDGGKITRSASNGEEADEWSAAYKAKMKFELR